MSWILITGANRGLGLQTAIKLSKNGKKVIFAGRDENKLRELSSNYPGSEYVKLDISNNESILSLPTTLKSKGVENIEVLVNNAAVLHKGWNEELYNQTLQTNVFGTLLLTETLLPFIPNSGKIVNVSSGLGQLNELSADYTTKVLNFKSLNQFTLNQIPFVNDDEEIKSKYAPMYSISKALLNRITQILADDPRIKEKNIRVGSVCPGWCRTDMGGASAPRQAEDGADSISWVVLHDDLPSPSFHRDGQSLPW